MEGDENSCFVLIIVKQIQKRVIFKSSFFVYLQKNIADSIPRKAFSLLTDYCRGVSKNGVLEKETLYNL